VERTTSENKKNAMQKEDILMRFSRSLLLFLIECKAVNYNYYKSWLRLEVLSVFYKVCINIWL